MCSTFSRPVTISTFSRPVTLTTVVPDELVPDSDDELLPALRESSESSEDEAEALEKGAPSQLACEPSKLVCFSPRCPL